MARILLVIVTFAVLIGVALSVTSSGQEPSVLSLVTPRPTVGTAPTQTLMTTPAGTLRATRASTPSPTPELKLWRWVNVSVVAPKNYGVSVFRLMSDSDTQPPPGSPVMAVAVNDIQSPHRQSTVAIDAENGSITRSNVLPEHQSTMDSVSPASDRTPRYLGRVHLALQRRAASGRHQSSSAFLQLFPSSPEAQVCRSTI